MWAVAKDCGESAPDGCPSYSLTLTETPTRIFNFVDGQFSYQAMGVFRTKETFNRSCVSVASCSELTDPAQNIACLDQGSTQCVCSIETDATGTSSGSFQTQGANVTLTYDDGTNESYVYCMKNDRMYFFFEDGTHLAMRRCTVSGCD